MRNPIWLKAYETKFQELIDNGENPDEAESLALAYANDYLADYGDYKYQEYKDQRNGC